MPSESRGGTFHKGGHHQANNRENPGSEWEKMPGAGAADARQATVYKKLCFLLV
jgi:hypothetical protein